MIRRNRKRKDEISSGQVVCHSQPPVGNEPIRPRGRPLRDPTAEIVDITTEQRLERFLGAKHMRSLKPLAILLEEHAAAWQGTVAFDKLAEDASTEYFRFEEDQAQAWVAGKKSLIIRNSQSSISSPNSSKIR